MSIDMGLSIVDWICNVQLCIYADQESKKYFDGEKLGGTW